VDPLNELLAELASKQYAAFTTKQFIACGRSHAALHRAVAAGDVTCPHPGVYVVAGAPRSWEQSLTIAVLAGGPGAVASHRSGARLWGLTDDRDDTIEITVPRSRGPRIKGVTVHRSSDLVAGHVTEHNRIPVTKPARVIVDLGAVLPADKVEDALDRALTRRLISIAGVEWMLNELPRRGRNGAGVAARILDQRALGRAAADGQLEPRMARLLRKAALPAAIYHFEVRDAAGRLLAEVDFAYPELRLAIEVDGWSIHGTPRAMGKDFIRQNGLVPYGWHVLRFTWDQVVRKPDYVAATIAAARSALAAAA
jgi:very-short-patch-repair endonuclease